MSIRKNEFEETLLIEWLATRCGISALADRLPFGSIYPPYLYLCIFLLFDFGVVNGYRMSRGGQHIFAETPTVVVGPLALILAAFGIRYMATEYRDAITALRISDRDIDSQQATQFNQIVSLQTKLTIYAVSAILLYGYVIFNIGLVNIIASEGVVELLNRLFVWELGYLPFLVEFALLYFGIQLGIPRQIHRLDLRVFFYDPRNMGGFAPIGQLLKRSYYMYTIGLLLYFVLTYGSSLFDGGTQVSQPGLVEAGFFSAAWLLGVASIGYSMWVIHQLMSEQKESRIREIEDEIRDLIENPYEINASKVSDQAQLEDLQRRLTQVRGTKTYPATFTMWSQIGISVLLPQILQLAVQATL